MWLLLPDGQHLVTAPSCRTLAESPTASEYVACVIEQEKGGYKVETLETIASFQP